MINPVNCKLSAIPLNVAGSVMDIRRPSTFANFSITVEWSCAIVVRVLRTTLPLDVFSQFRGCFRCGAAIPPMCQTWLKLYIKPDKTQPSPLLASFVGRGHPMIMRRLRLGVAPTGAVSIVTRIQRGCSHRCLIVCVNLWVCFQIVW